MFYYQSMSIVDIRVHSLCCTLYNVSTNASWYASSIIDLIVSPPFSAPFAHLSLLSEIMATADLLTLFNGLLFCRMSYSWNHYTVKSAHGLWSTLSSKIGFFDLAIWLEVFSTPSNNLVAHFLLALNNIPLPGWPIVYFSNCILKDVLAAFSLVWIWKKLLWTVVCRFLSSHKFSTYLTI